VANSKKILELGPSQRRWAMPRHLQRFWGQYALNNESGLYFARGSSAARVQIVVETFKKLPPQFAALCHEWKLTVSFAEGWTATGNASTFYADFSQSSPADISPHVEISEQSFKPGVIIGHLAHEVAHLFWRTRTFEQKQAYRIFLANSCSADTVEVTAYVQDFLKEYLGTLKDFARGKVHPNLHEGNFNRWTEESFCDTVATVLARKHPDRSPACTISVKQRRKAMAEFLQLFI